MFYLRLNLLFIYIYNCRNKYKNIKYNVLVLAVVNTEKECWSCSVKLEGMSRLINVRIINSTLNDPLDLETSSIC